jgi:hypothetical protein
MRSNAIWIGFAAMALPSLSPSSYSCSHNAETGEDEIEDEDDLRDIPWP